MASFNLENIKIKGISCAVPNNRVETVSFYPKFGKKYVDNFINMTGVKSTYRTSEKQTASDLCFVAAKTLLEAKKIPTEDIGALVFISQTPDYNGAPATACVLHKRLGLSKDCMAFDVTLGCSGYVYGLNIVGSLLQTLNSTSKFNKALLLFGDTSVKGISPEDKSVAMLFGEAGSATLLVKEVDYTGDRLDPLYGELMTDGDGFKAIITPSGGQRNPNGDHERTLWGDGNIRSDFDCYMNGTDVFSFTITRVPKLIKRFMEERNQTIDDYDSIVLHQANLYILKQIAKHIKCPMEKILISIDRYGNTSGTSIPLTLCDSYGGTKVITPQNKLNVLMGGFGVGFSWGVVSAALDRADILPVIYSDEYYTEGGVSHD